VKSVNNLLACDRALPDERSVQWEERAELQDLFSAYLSRVVHLSSTHCITFLPAALLRH